MTNQQLTTQVKALGLAVKWLPEWNEYRLTDPTLSKARQEDVAYYGNDKDDVLLTAQTWAKALNKC